VRVPFNNGMNLPKGAQVRALRARSSSMSLRRLSRCSADQGEGHERKADGGVSMGTEGLGPRPRNGDRWHRSITSGSLGVLVLLLVAISIGCLRKGVTEPTADAACGGAVSVSAGPGTQPTFAWNPPCRVFDLLVEEAGGLDVWEIAARDGISPGLRYGAIPPGSIQQQGAMPLQAGRRYEVVLFKGTSLDAVTLIGHASFTP